MNQDTGLAEQPQRESLLDKLGGMFGFDGAGRRIGGLVALVIVALAAWGCWRILRKK